MAETTISPSTVIDGEISGDEALVLQGSFKGKVSVAGTVAIEESAVVDADIEASSIVVGGQLSGSASADERVEVRSRGRLVGDIRAPRVVIADGATFKGTVEMNG